MTKQTEQFLKNIGNKKEIISLLEQEIEALSVYTVEDSEFSFCEKSGAVKGIQKAIEIINSYG